MAQKVLILAGLLTVACTGSEEGGIPPGARLVTGNARTAASNDGVNQRQAMQAVAVYAAEVCGGAAIRIGDAAEGVAACAIFGDPFDPGELGAPFRVLLPCDVSVNLLIQEVATSDARTPGDLVALIAFPTGTPGETSTLVPREVGSDLAEACRDTELRATNIVDLGDFSIPASAPEDGPAVVVLGGAEGGVNPLAIVDTDGDTESNLADADDDDDDVLDADDDDDDGDGAADLAQGFNLAWWE